MAVPGKPSQDFIPIKDIRSGVMMLNDGSLRMLIMTSTLNFQLKSSDEQEAIILQFQNFLNSLEFPIQIYVQSKRLDIKPYMRMLEERKSAQLLDAMKIQVTQYIEFIRDRTEHTNIMSKTFFIIVPYSRSSLRKDTGNPLASFAGGGNKKKAGATTEAELQDFEEARIQLEQRVSIVEDGLARCDIRTRRLGTEEITELFYHKFNPGELESAVA